MTDRQAGATTPPGLRAVNGPILARLSTISVNDTRFPLIGVRFFGRGLRKRFQVRQVSGRRRSSVEESQFIALIAELDDQVGEPAPTDHFVTMTEEALLARLDPIERAIMGSPAQTITGLSVKARDLPRVLSEYSKGPIDQTGWEGRAVRVLVEAICEVARVPLRI